MNASNAKDYLPLVQALADGKVIQVNVSYASGHEKWVDSGELEFAHAPNAYRIKPEPREIWVNHYTDRAFDVGPYTSYEQAKRLANPGAKQVRYREVIE